MMRPHLPCALVALAAALAGGGLGCSSRRVRDGAAEVCEEARARRATAGDADLVFAAFLRASAPQGHLAAPDALPVAAAPGDGRPTHDG